MVRAASAAEHAKAHHADPPLPGGRIVDVVPHSGRFLRLKLRRAPMEAQDMQQHIFGHACGQPVIDHAHDRDVLRQLGVREDVLDPGAEPEDRLEVRIALEVALAGFQTSANSISSGSPISGHSRKSISGAILAKASRHRLARSVSLLKSSAIGVTS